MSVSGELLGSRPQGCFIKLYYQGTQDEGIDGEVEEWASPKAKEEAYELHTISYVLQPTGVAVCTFNTPKNMNALTRNQQWEMFALLEHMARDDNVRVAVWTGRGTKAFNAGADLRGDPILTIPEHIRENMLARGMGPVDGDFVLKAQTLAFWDFPKPSIAAVNGMAVGGAANIALANYHDLVICSSNACFMYPFPKLGFTPELGSSFMMPYLVGMAKAKEMFYLSDWFSGDQAKELGLVNKVVAPEQLMPEAMQLAERLCLLHPSALENSKKILNHHIRKQLEGILDDEQEAIMRSLKATKGPGGVKKWMVEQEERMKQVRSNL